MSTSKDYLDQFRALVESRVADLTIRGSKGTGLCLFHLEQDPSFSIDFEKGLFHCFSCGIGGNIRKFFQLVGEPWPATSLNHQERRRWAVTHHRKEAERRARKAAQQAFEDWHDTQASRLHERRRALSEERAETKFLYRLACRWPQFFNDDEYAQLVRKLGRLYNLCLLVHQDIQYLVDPDTLVARFTTWRAESEAQDAA